MIRFDCNDVPADSLESSDRLEAAANYFIKEGYVILDNVLPRESVEGLYPEFVRDYAPFLSEQPSDQAYDVDDRRYLMSMRFSGAFANPQLFANPYVTTLIRKVLEPTAILEAYGCILSLPGATRQKDHYDGPHLFGTALSTMLPPYALTFGLPLVEMNEHIGTTLLRPGSHRWLEHRPDAPFVMPVVPPGSCMMWDYRLRHAGTENHSQTPRPMLYCTYARPWYKDPANFRPSPRMRRLAYEPGFLETLPEDVRKLFATDTA